MIWGVCGRGDAGGEEFSDDIFEGSFEDADVIDGVLIEDAGECSGDVLFFDLQSDAGTAVFEESAEALEVFGDAVPGELEFDDFMSAEAIEDSGEWSVVDDLSLVDDHGASAERFDVLHVVAGEDDSDAMFALPGSEEVLDFALADDIESDGGFIEEEDFWSVEESGDEFHAHAFAE